MKLYSVSMVKDEEDIIKSMIMHNSQFLDGMLILDNQSNDNTVNILEELKENYPIHVYYDDNPEYLLIEKVDQLIKRAAREYQADVIISLDADELLAPSSIVRQTLEGLNPYYLYLVYWRNYIPTTTDDHDEPLIHKRITHHIPSHIPTLPKVIIPREIALNTTITMGCHNVTPQPPTLRINDLYIAHYPIRTPQQIYEKANLNTKGMEYDRTPGHHTHIRSMFTEFQTHYPSWDDLKRLSYKYTQAEHSNDDLVYEPIQ